MTPSSSIIFSRGQKIASYGFVTVAVYKLPGADIRVSVVNARDPSQRYRTTIPVAYVESKTGVSVGSDADLTAACKRLCDGVGITASGEIAFGADDAVASPAMPALAEPVVKDVVMTEPAPAAIIVDDPTAP